MDTGKVIKKLRQEEGLTQDDLSKILEVNKSSIQKYESGAVNNLKMDTIRTLCELFKVPPWVFIFPEHLVDCEHLLKFKHKGDVTQQAEFVSVLNEKGLTKLVEYARDLIDSGNYRIESQDEVKISQDQKLDLD